MTTKRAAIYCRVSRDEQADNWSLPTQEAACRKYAEERGYEVVGVWLEDFTGSVKRRPELDKVMQLVRAHRLDVLLCYEMSRLTRGGARHVGWFMSELEDHAVSLKLVTEELDDSEEGDVMAGMKGYAARKQWLATREASNRGLRAKAKSGKAIGRARPPFGLRYKPPMLDADGKPIKATVNAAYEEDPTTIEYVRWMFRQADEGASLRSIAKGLGEMGVKPPYSDRTGSVRWNPASIRHVLTNACYTGEAVQFKVRVEKHPDPQFKTKRTRREIDPDGDGAIPVPPGVYPVVLDKALFDRVQRRLEQNKRESQRADRNPEFGILRRGIARCGHCNSSLVVTYNSGKSSDGKEATYGCQAIQRERHGCPRCDVNVLKLDREVWSWIVAIRDDPRLVEVFADRLRTGEDESEKSARLLDVLDGRIAETDAQRSKLTKRLALVDDDTAQLVAEELRRLAEQRKALVLQRDRASVKAQSEDRRRRRVERAVEMVAGVADPGCDLDALSYQEKRRILLDLGAVVHVYPKDHHPRWSMTLAFDNDRSRIRVVGDGNSVIVWDEDGDLSEMTFYLSSIPGRTGTWVGATGMKIACVGGGGTVAGAAVVSASSAVGRLVGAASIVAVAVSVGVSSAI